MRLCEMAVSLGVKSVEAMSELWDIHQTVKTWAEDIVKIRYQETTSEDIEGFMCAAVTVIFRVCKPVRLKSNPQSKPCL
jgi:Cys-tRNA synthase (O-phospho-L-seryl-tRNA:Cys-tRNA synthase)